MKGGSYAPVTKDLEANTRYGSSTVGPAEEKPRKLDLLGVAALKSLTQDGRILMACRSLRLFAFGFLAVVLATYLTTMGFSESQVGALYTLTLVGDVLLSLYITSRADVFGRRRMLIISAVLKVITGVVFSISTNFWVLTVAATIGVISPSGNEVGPFLAIEQAGLTQTIKDTDRTRVFSWHNLFGYFSTALGGLACGLILTYLIDGRQLDRYTAYRVVMVLYSVLASGLIFLFAALSPEVEPRVHKLKETPVGQFLGLHESKGLVLRLSLLFMLDSFGGAFVLQSLISNWFFVSYGTKDAVLGGIVFICNIVAGISSLFAAALADKIGLIVTMVVTHLPSNILLILVPLMPNELWSIIIICARFCISQMDVPTRNSYVVAVVREDERSAAGGVTNIVRSLGAATGPYLAGLLYERPQPYRDYPFYIAGGLKALYDLLLLASFTAVKPPEEAAKAKEAAAAKAASNDRAPLKGSAQVFNERTSL